MIGSPEARALVVALLLVGCESNPTPTPTATSEPAAIATEAPSSSATPSPSEPNPERSPIPLLDDEPPPPTTAVGKIQAAVAAGTLDVATGYLYRAYATVGDPRLPEEYRGGRGEDRGLEAVLRTELPTLPPEIQDQLTPFLVRPTDPLSYWNQPAPSVAGVAGLARSGVPGGGTRPDPPAAVVACVDGWMHDRVAVDIPVMLWSRCQFDPVAAEARLEEARTYMIELWYPMTNLMGPPLGDRNIANDGIPDPPEGDDGIIDIYLAAGAVAERDLSTSGYGRAYPTTPFEGSAGAERSSSYLVIRSSLRGLILKATIAHEFFHVLQNTHNLDGQFGCQGAPTTAGCTAATLRMHWFAEASATWAEHNFVPAARGITDGPYYQWEQFLTTTNGLTEVDGANEYMSWAWALFMEQEWDADIIGNTWRAIRGKIGWAQLDGAIDAQLSFEQRFDDFAVRVVNREFLPGDPIKPRFRDPRLDPTFPESTPSGDRYNEEVREDLARALQAPTTSYTYTITLDNLASAYFPFAPPPGARTLRWEFAALAPEIEVDAIVRVGQTWERRELPASETVWCLETPKDAVEEGYLIFSNHDLAPGRLTRPWSVTAEEAGCGAPIGTLVYSFLDTAPIGGLPGSGQTIDASVQVRLQREPDSSGYLNDGSTYGIVLSTKVILAELPDGCQVQSQSTGTPGGALAFDSITGATYLGEDGIERLGLGITLPVHMEVTEDWCASGSAHSSSESTVSYPPCDGVENVGARTETTQTFEFECDFQGTTQSWSVSGTVVINR